MEKMRSSRREKRERYRQRDQEIAQYQHQQQQQQQQQQYEFHQSISSASKQRNTSISTNPNAFRQQPSLYSFSQLPPLSSTAASSHSSYDQLLAYDSLKDGHNSKFFSSTRELEKSGRFGSSNNSSANMVPISIEKLTNLSYQTHVLLTLYLLVYFTLHVFIPSTPVCLILPLICYVYFLRVLNNRTSDSDTKT